jgi:hypothetical protein
LVVAIAAVILTPAVAMACRITNATLWQGDNAAETVYVWFDCGVSCGNYFEIEPGKSVSHPKKSGYVQGCTYDGQVMHSESASVAVDTYNRETGDRIKVDAHGEARVTIPGGAIERFHWAVYDVDNNLARSVVHGWRYFEYDSSSTYCWDGSP